MKPTSLQGAVAGFIATVPMTLVMKGLQELSRHRHRDIPPREITRRSARDVGIPLTTNSPAETLLTVLTHFGYGAAAGSTYPQCLVGPAKPGLASGTTFGLAVWAISYLGLMPALRLQPPVKNQPPQRNAVMITAHAVWGAALGLLARRMTQSKAVRDSSHSGDIAKRTSRRRARGRRTLLNRHSSRAQKLH